MKITARQIADWADTSEARGELPRLIRKLIHTTGKITEASIPAGDSVTQPGFDGEVFSETGNAWVPVDRSFWEMSCRNDVGTKANEDYDKRVSEVSPAERAELVYIAVTARRWANKQKWLEGKAVKRDWRGVRAYDVDDLEQWLEESPAVALEFGETLGLTGDGVESLSSYWRKWSTQSEPAISQTALLSGRTGTTESLLTKIRKPDKASARNILSIKADSVEEAVAVTAACLMDDPKLSAATAIVTDAGGWRFVDKNPQIKIAVSSRPEIAESPSSRKGLTVVVPYASGDMSGHFPDAADRADNTEVRLERPGYGEFEEALVGIGTDPSEASRLSRHCGRSWTVFRRHRSPNPSIRRPRWLDHPSATSLSTICLVGGWSSNHEADRKFVERIAGMAHSEVESRLVEIGRLDDAPIIRIGGIWKAKSALELLALFGDRITDEQLERFFSAVEDVLSAPDPQLELPDEERYTAVVHGKIRPESGLLIDSVCDTLIKLAVRGPDVEGLRDKCIEQRVAALVHQLLDDADPTRWLSLSGVLPQLAEAAPRKFLMAIEKSLTRPDAPVRALIEETRGSGFMERGWHTGLLWALETLAWAPERLARVALILARLTETEVKGNWVNTPNNSLVNIFRSWLPQTAATVEERITALDTLVRDVPDAAYHLLDCLACVGPDFAHRTPRPKWRDDDARAGQGTTDQERFHMLVAAVDRQIEMAVGHPNRIVKLIEKLDKFDEPRVERMFEFLETFTRGDTSDADKELLRSAIRSRIHWHRNYDKIQGEELNSKLSRYEAAYKALEPTDLVLRHGWLFANGWPDLPIRTREENDSAQIEQWRTTALRELYESESWSGVTRMARDFAGGWPIGWILSRLNINVSDIADWVVNEATDFEKHGEDAEIIGGVLWALHHEHEEKMINLIKRVLSRPTASNWTIDKTVKFLALAPAGRPVWNLVAGLGEEADRQYWQICSVNIRLRDNKDEFDYALRRFISTGRPRTALTLCHHDFEKTPADTLVQILEGIHRGEEAEAGFPERYYIQKALDRIEQSDAITRDRLIGLEFALIPLLGFEGEQRAKTLYHAIMSDPKLFTELLCILYEPSHRESDDSPSAPNEAAIHSAWTILHDCGRQPGTAENDTVNPDDFVAFIEEARDLCAKSDRLEVCDDTLGQILGRAPEGADGVFPFEPARDVLDRSELEEMRSGFGIGCRNKRRVVSGSPTEGGAQERELVEYYRKQAEALDGSHPRLAGTLHALADYYESDACREDLNAELRKEGIW